jgi:hypothetical protein
MSVPKMPSSCCALRMSLGVIAATLMSTVAAGAGADARIGGF